LKILVTGGTGFVGSYVLLELIQRGEEITVFDIEPASKVARDIQEKLTWIQGDIRDLAQIETAIEKAKPEVIIHLAALLQYGCMENPRRAVEVNVLGLSNVLETCRKRGIRRVVTASSAAAYGVLTKTMKETEPIPTNVTLYGATKFFGEILCRQYIENYKLEATNMRYFGVYGPGEVRSPGIAKVLKDIESIVTGKNITLPTIRETDHIHLAFVADAAHATVLAATVPGPLSLVYNIAGGPESYVTYGEIVRTIQEMVPNCGQVVFQGKERDRGPMDTSLARRELGYEPRYSPKDGLRESVQFFLKGRS